MGVVCGGHFTLGVGLGYRDVEYDAFAIPRRERVRRFEENLRLVEALWAGAAVSADLSWCRLNDERSPSFPSSGHDPPCGWPHSDRAVERAARMADSWMINPHATTSTIARQLELFAPGSARAGPAAAPRAPRYQGGGVRPHSRAGSGDRAALPHGEVRGIPSLGAGRGPAGGETFDLPFERLVQDRFVIGTPDDCLHQLLSWRDDLGVDHFIFRPFWSGMPVETALESMDLLSREVRPGPSGTMKVARTDDSGRCRSSRNAEAVEPAGRAEACENADLQGFQFAMISVDSAREGA